MYLYTLYDKVAEEAGPLFQAKNDQVAARQSLSILAQVYDPNDFDLLKVGEFSTSGQIEIFGHAPVVVVLPRKDKEAEK